MRAARRREAVVARYRLYGHALRSSLDLPCPHRPHASGPEVQLEAGEPEQFERCRSGQRAPKGRANWFQCRRLRDRSTYLRWEGLFEFLVSADGRRILYHALGGATPEAFTTYLLGQVLSFSLLALGEEPLHGTAVVVGNRAIAFLGDGGYGKSTLGAACLARGYPILSDDLLAMEPSGAGYRMHPGVPRIKVFPAVSCELFGLVRGTPLNGGTSKRIVPLEEGQVYRRSAPLATLYVLSPPGLRVRRVNIETLPRSQAVLEIIRNSFNTIVQDRARLARQFRFASRLVARIPVKRLSYPRSLDRLPAVCDAVLDDLAG
jgi:hypothetical protein